jgi:hypothetical protein
LAQTAASSASQMPSPQFRGQSEHVDGDSVVPQYPSPQKPQSYGQDAPFSVPSHWPLPQLGPQSTGQLTRLSVD